MLHWEKGNCQHQENSKSRKKPKTQRELEKLATSINYDLQGGDGKMGVQLVGI